MKKNRFEIIKNHPQVVALVLSLVLHATMGGFAWVMPALQSRFSPPKAVTEIELIDPNELIKQLEKQKHDQTKINGQIVEQNDQRLNDEIPEDSRFLSKHNQKVVQETQAALKGKFKNTDSTDGQVSPQKKLGKTEQNHRKDKAKENQPKDIEPNQKLLTASDGIPTRTGKPSLRDLTPSFKPTAPKIESDDIALGGGQGPSMSDDHLKNVATGMQTLLSTREFVYYSYYNRIKDKLRQYWEPKIKEKMERIMRQGRTIASTSDKITRIVILLDEKGTLVRVQVLSPSGVTDLDDAAIEAFKAAAPFPNPPKGIVESDGMIRIRWDFILEA
jgi:protein TonB